MTQSRQHSPPRRRVTPSAVLFLAGLLTLPLLALQPATSFLAIQCGICIAAATLAGKRISYLYFIILVLSVTLFHLITPNGELLVMVFGFPVTSGALRAGLHKGLLVSSFVFCSLATVNRNLRLPGKTGALLATMFSYFDALFVQRKRLKRKKILQGIDELLIELIESNTAAPATAPAAVPPPAWGRTITKAILFVTPHIVLVILAQ